MSKDLTILSLLILVGVLSYRLYKLSMKAPVTPPKQDRDLFNTKDLPNRLKHTEREYRLEHTDD